jgi:hypothetical protein
MHGKAAASARSGGTRGSENAASVYLRGGRGNVEQRGAFPWGAHERDRQTQRDSAKGSLAAGLLVLVVLG